MSNTWFQGRTAFSDFIPIKFTGLTTLKAKCFCLNHCRARNGHAISFAIFLSLKGITFKDKKTPVQSLAWTHFRNHQWAHCLDILGLVSICWVGSSKTSHDQGQIGKTLTYELCHLDHKISGENTLKLAKFLSARVTVSR